MFCGQCGEFIPDSNNFCSKCGAPIAPTYKGEDKLDWHQKVAFNYESENAFWHSNYLPDPTKAKIKFPIPYTNYFTDPENQTVVMNTLHNAFYHGKTPYPMRKNIFFTFIQDVYKAYLLEYQNKKKISWSCCCLS